MIKQTAIAFSLAVLVAASGCGKGTTQQGTLYNVAPGPELKTYLPDTLDAVHKAAIAALEQDMGYTLNEQAIDAREGLIKGRTAMDRKVRVKMTKVGDDVTQISVTVSRDEVAARQLLDAIEARAK